MEGEQLPCLGVLLPAGRCELTGVDSRRCEFTGVDSRDSSSNESLMRLRDLGVFSRDNLGRDMKEPSRERNEVSLEPSRERYEVSLDPSLDRNEASLDMKEVSLEKYPETSINED